MTFKYAVVINGKLEKFSHENRDVLLQRIKTALVKNNINYNLSDLNKAIDRQSKLKTKTKVGGISFGAALNGAKALLRYTQGDAASMKEMYRRAEICEKCPMISKVSDCMGCGASGRVASSINAIRSMKKTEAAIPTNVKTKFCSICKCSIPLMIVTRYKDFYREEEEVNNRRPDICWLKRASPNFTNE